MSKHTPGPWTVDGLFARGPRGITVGAAYSGGVMCVGGSYIISDETAHTNARLIAAAPELLAALKLAREELDRLPHSLGYDFTHIPKIDAAIAKATGEGA